MLAHLLLSPIYHSFLSHFVKELDLKITFLLSYFSFSCFLAFLFKLSLFRKVNLEIKHNLSHLTHKHIVQGFVVIFYSSV